MKMTEAQRKAMLANKAEIESVENERAKKYAKRDRLIAATCATGVSLREVAELYGLSHQAISKIVAKESGS